MKTDKRHTTAAARRILNRAKNCGKSELLTKALTGSDFLQIFGNPYQAVKINDALPLAQNDKETSRDMAETFERFFKNAIDESGETLEAPSASDLKEFIFSKKAEAKEKGKRIYGGIKYNLTDRVTVDASLLLDVLYLLPKSTIFLNKDKKRQGFSAIYFKSNYGEGILMPVRT